MIDLFSASDSFSVGQMPYVPDEDVLAPSFLIYALREGGRVTRANCTFYTRKSLDQVVGLLIKEAGGRVFADFAPLDDGHFCGVKVIISTDYCAQISRGQGDLLACIVKLTTTSDKVVEAFRKVIKGIRCDPPPPVEDDRGKVHAMIQTMHGVSVEEVGFAGIKFDPANYNEGVVKDFEFVRKDIVSSRPSGRLAVFSGPPGTGKTHLVKSLLTTPGADFVLFDVASIGNVQGPKILTTLLSHKGDDSRPIVLIVEDGDDAIRQRGKSETGLVSNLLNLTDGIVGSVVDIRVVVTSNLENTEIDHAVQRKGRLIRHIHVGPLSMKRANDLYSRLVGRKVVRFTKSTTLAEVYADARDAGWEPSKEKDKSEEVTYDATYDSRPKKPTVRKKTPKASKKKPT